MDQKIQFDNAMSHWPDEKLAGLFSVATLLWFQHAPALAIHVCEVVRAECQRRAGNRASADNYVEPQVFGIDFGAWSDTDVAHSLGLTAILTQDSTDVELGEMVDSLHTALVGIAAYRLKTSGDPRDDLSFEQRWGTPDVDPETN